MLAKDRVTNLLLTLIAAALLLMVGQGRLAPLFTASSEAQPATDADVPPARAEEVEQQDPDIEEQAEGPVSSVVAHAERWLLYAILMLALAYGVEAGVELLQWILSFDWIPEFLKLEKEPGPAEILKALSPWLPDSTLIPSEQTEDRQGPVGPPPAGGGELPHSDDGQDERFRARRKALLGIAQRLARCRPDVKWGWAEIFWALAQEQRTHLRNRDIRILRNRALSLLVAIPFAFLTRVNTFDILLGPDGAARILPQASADRAFYVLWYDVGGIFLTAFAATAGSAVWHDLLDKLRQSKEEPSQPEEG